MSKSRVLFVLLSLAVLVPVISGSLGRAATEERVSEDSLSKHLAVFSEVLSLIRRAYVEESSMEDLLRGALNGSIDALDPLATYVPAESVEAYRQVRQVGSRHSGLTLAKERGIAFVVAVDPDSPGAEAGLEPGDIIAKIDELSTRRMPLWSLQSAFAGQPGTRLELEILRRGQTRDTTLTLATYRRSPPRLEEIQGQRLLRISRFESEDLQDFRSILSTLTESAADRLLIDVRGVAAGSAEAAFAVAGLFAGGQLGELRVRDETTLHFQSTERPLWQGETVILVDHGSQGAAEIFATVLRQLAGSLLVGRSTFGHAGRQRMMPLSDGSQLLLTDAFYCGPDGQPIDQSLTPDEAVSDFSGRFGQDESPERDSILERGLEVLVEPREQPAREVA